MAFNGSGTFVRLYSWVTDRINGVLILASRMDEEMDGMATGLSTCITKDGQTTLTADLPMASHKLTGMSAGSARGDSTRVAEVQDSTFTYCGTSSGTDTITASASPAITAYVVGQRFQFKAGGTNTGATTLNISSVGAGAVQNLQQALAAGEITAGDMVEVEVSATTPVFQIVSPTIARTRAQTWSGVQTFSNGIIFANETLSTYDEGTWTATITFGSGSTTYTAQTMRYIRVGNLVFISGYLQLNTVSAPSGTATLGGLPFTVTNANQNYSALTCRPSGFAATLTTSMVGRFEVNTTTVRLTKAAATGGATDETGADFANSCVLIIGGCYAVA